MQAVIASLLSLVWYVPKAIYSIGYTSDKTGEPKGVMHSLKNIDIVDTASGDIYSITKKSRKPAYLPLAHVAERAVVEVNQLCNGYKVFFSCSLDTFGVAEMAQAIGTIALGKTVL